jgi:hypothetical protein
MSKGIKTIEQDQRLGRVRVADNILRESINTGIAARIFYGSVPIDLERDWMRQITTYTLWHPQFDRLEDGENVPNYTALIENGVSRWEREV